MRKEEKKDFKYDAFISYRHAPLDMYVAQTLQKELESFKVPGLADKETKELGKDGIKRIFRDKDELPLAGNLSEPITYALKNSEYLIVICSPRTPESMWVQREIETFAQLRGIENIFAVLIEGEPKDAFPPQLTKVQRLVTLEDGTQEMQETLVEPLAADVRGETKSIVHKNIRKEILRLAAPMLGCSYDDLKQRHKMRKLKRLLVSCAVAGAIFLAFGAFSTYQAIRINQQNNKNLELQSKSLSAQALELYEQGNKQDGLLVTLAGLPHKVNRPERPITADSLHALSNILQVYSNHTDFLPYQVLEQDAQTYHSVMTGDGQKIVSIDAMGNLYSWDMETGKQLAKLQTDDGIYSDNMYALGENSVLFGGSQGVTCYNADNMEVLWQNENDGERVSYMAISQDQSLLAFSDYGKVHVIKTEDGSELSSWDLKDNLESGYNMTFSEDGKYLLYEEPAAEDGTGKISIMDVATGTLKNQLTMKYQMLNAVAYTGKGECFIASMSADQFGENGFTSMQAIDCYNPDGTLAWEKTGVNSVDAPFRFYNDWLVYPAGDSIYMVSKSDGEVKKEFHYSSRVTKYVVSTEGDMVVACLLDGTISNHMISNDQYSKDYLEPANQLIDTIFRNRDLVVRVPRGSSNIYIYKNVVGSKMEDLGELSCSNLPGQITSDGSKLISFGNQMMQIYDLNSKKTIAYEEYENYVLDGCLLDNEKKLLVILGDSVHLYDTSTGEELNSLKAEIYSTYIDLKNQKFTIITTNSDLITYNMEDFKEIARMEDCPSFDSIVSIKDGKEMIGCSANGSSFILNTESGKSEELPWKSRFIDVSPDGEYYLACDEESKTVALFKGDEKEPVNSIECKTTYLKDIGLSSDGSKFFVLMQNGHLEIYDTKTFKRLKVYENMKDIDSLDTEGTIYLLYNKKYNDTAYLLNKDLDIVAEVPDFMGITKDESHIYTVDLMELMSGPVYNLQMLMDEAKQVLDGRSLDEDKAVQYYVQ